MGALVWLQLRQQPLPPAPPVNIGTAQLALPQQPLPLPAITTMYVTPEKVPVHAQAIAKALQLPLVHQGKLGMERLV